MAPIEALDDSAWVIRIDELGRRAIRSATRRTRVSPDALYGGAAQADLRAALTHHASVLDDVSAQLRGHAARDAPFVLVRGLPVERADILVLGLASALGTVVDPYRTAWSQLVQTVVPARDRVLGDRVLNEYLHTDSTDWPEPNDYTCLLCVVPDSGGAGASRLLCADDLLTEHGRESDELIACMGRTPLPWRIADPLGGGVHWAPPLDLSKGRVRWMKETVLLAMDDQSHPELTDLVEGFGRMIERCAATRHILLSPGDLLIINNRRCLHARTPIPQHCVSSRRFLRAKVRSHAHVD